MLMRRKNNERGPPNLYYRVQTSHPNQPQQKRNHWSNGRDLVHSPLKVIYCCIVDVVFFNIPPPLPSSQTSSSLRSLTRTLTILRAHLLPRLITAKCFDDQLVRTQEVGDVLIVVKAEVLVTTELGLAG
jgi:hypothetical protein